MSSLTHDELARLVYLLHGALEEARQLDLDESPPNASDRIEIALTEARKILRLVEARAKTATA